MAGPVSNLHIPRMSLVRWMKIGRESFARIFNSRESQLWKDDLHLFFYWKDLISFGTSTRVSHHVQEDQPIEIASLRTTRHRVYALSKIELG